MSRLAFSHLNLRFNPFGELTREQRTKVAIVELDGLVQYLQQPNTAIQFLADHGYGKSTHLLALHSHLPESPYTQLHLGDDPTFKVADVNFIDSIENLTHNKRLRLYRRSRSIALTTHTNLEDELRKAGYELLTIEIKQSDPERISQVLNRRIEYARREQQQPIPFLTMKTILKLIEKYGMNIREMEHQLYETFQDLQEIKDV